MSSLCSWVIQFEYQSVLFVLTLGWDLLYSSHC